MNDNQATDTGSIRDMEEQAFRLQAPLDGLAKLIEAASPTGTVGTGDTRLEVLDQRVRPGDQPSGPVRPLGVLRVEPDGPFAPVHRQERGRLARGYPIGAQMRRMPPASSPAARPSRTG